MTPENTRFILSHIRFAPTSWLAFWIAKRRKIPYIHIEHGTGFLIHRNPIITGVAKFVDYTIGKYIIRNADRVICVSEAGKRWVNTTFGRTEDIDVIYRGFEFPNIARKHNTIPKIGFVGRLTGLKNVRGLLEGLSELQEEEWTLEIVGDGEERETLEKLSKSYAIENRVIFHGAKSHDWIMTEFYPGIDIFVNPSLQEGLPTTVIEALGMGCQIIATDVGGTREIGGIRLVPAHNKQALREKIIEILQSSGVLPSYDIHEFSHKNMGEDFRIIFDILSRKKIYFLINSLEGGGAERVVSRLSGAFIDEFDVDIITLKSCNTSYILDERVRIVQLSQIERYNILLFFLIPYFAFCMRVLIRENRYTNGISFLEISNFVHIFARKTPIISMRTSIGYFQGVTGMVYKYCIKLLYPHAGKIIVNSKENKYKLGKFVKIGSENIVTIYNPIDMKEVFILTQEKIPQKMENVCRDKQVFITTGRLIKSKNHISIIEGFSYINFPAVLLVLGDGPERGALEKKIQELNLGEKIFLLGFQKNVFPYIKRSDYFIYASQIEGFPNALMEAMVLKKPIISSDFETGARECIFGRYVRSRLKYPIRGPYGVLLGKESFTKDLIDFIPLIHTLSEKSRTHKIESTILSAMDDWRKLLKI